MTPSYAIKKGVRYRYYVSSVLNQGRKEEAGSLPRVAAQAVERIVLDAIGVCRRRSKLSPARPAIGRDAASRAGLRRAEAAERLRPMSTKSPSALGRSKSGSSKLLNRPSKVVAIPWSPQTFRRKREIIVPPSKSGSGARPIRAEARRKLLSAIAKGRRWLDEMIAGKVEGIGAIAAREGVSERLARMRLSLAFLAPDIVRAAVDGTLPRGLGVSRLMDMPPSWADQRQHLNRPEPLSPRPRRHDQIRQRRDHSRQQLRP